MIKKVAVKLLLFFALLVVVDIAAGFILRSIYNKQNHGQYYRASYIMEKATPQLVVLGSSKANHHYIAKMMQDSLGISCFNAGLDGNFISYSNALFNCMMKRYTPKYVILDILDDEFEKRSYPVKDRVSSLLPYYRSHPEIREIVELKSPFEKYKLLSSLYTYNSLLLPMITGAADLHNKKEDEANLGYSPFHEIWKDTMAIQDSRNQALEPAKIKSLYSVVNTCKEKNATLIIIISPTYKKYLDGVNPTLELTKKVADSTHTVLWNYLDDSTYLNHREYFKDIRHLNDKGAQVFTRDVINRIKTLP